METIERKGRVRVKRNVLENFSDLSYEQQNNFKIIKKILYEVLGEEIDVYVFGSFYWGFWDDESDYDVKVDYVFNDYKVDPRIEKFSEIKYRLKNEYNIISDIIVMRDKKGILIP